jgi:hypothetical protein
MPQDDYRQALEKAYRDLQASLKERAALDTHIAHLRQTITGLSALSGVSPDAPDIYDHVPEDSVIENSWGITYHIKRALAASPIPLSAPQIKSAISKTEFQFDYANALTVIHNTLRRLERQGEVIHTKSGWTRKSPKGLTPPPSRR